MDYEIIYNSEEVVSLMPYDERATTYYASDCFKLIDTLENAKSILEAQGINCEKIDEEISLNE
jgi:hypothetical protein